MTTMLQEPGLQQRTESPAPFAGRGPQPTVTSPRRPLGTVLSAGLRSAGEKVLGLLLGVVTLVLQFAGYAAFVLALPLAPFLLPLLLLPVILAFGVLILGVGTVLGAAGLL
jgi:ABC-type transport system involved in cytochrome c biogenesis permease component